MGKLAILRGLGADVGEDPRVIAFEDSSTGFAALRSEIIGRAPFAKSSLAEFNQFDAAVRAAISYIDRFSAQAAAEPDLQTRAYLETLATEALAWVGDYVRASVPESA